MILQHMINSFNHCVLMLNWQIIACRISKLHIVSYTFPLSAIVPRHCYLTLHLTLQWAL